MPGPDRLPGPAPDPARAGWLAQWEYAHRGLHTGSVAENSPAAFAAAAQQGLGIECDVQVSADGQAMVFHDWELGRLTSAEGAVADRSADDLARLALRPGGERMPRLADLLCQVAARVPLMIEIKSRRRPSPAALCRAVSRDLRGYQGKAAVMSFDPRVGAWFAAHDPDVVRGLVVTEEGARGWRGAVRRHLALRCAAPDFLAYDVRDLPSRFAAAQRARGLPVLTWTVRTPALRAIAAAHADAAIAEGGGLAPAGGRT